MSEPVACWNGDWLPAQELAISIFDAGFVLGATVTEQLRTFRGELFRLEPHLDRLYQSLQLTGLESPLDRAAIRNAAIALVERNAAQRLSGGDLGVGIFVTPGTMSRFSGGRATGPNVCLYSYPLRFADWADRYERGERLVISSVRQIPAECLPPALKCRSRMHYYLADREAAQRNPQARAILLDTDGFLSEATTATLLIYRREEGLLTPKREKILPGISLQVVRELAAVEGWPIDERDLPPDSLFEADEVLLASTSSCLLPVVQVDGQPVTDGRPGPVFRRLLSRWSELVGIDIAGQASQLASISR